MDSVRDHEIRNFSKKMTFKLNGKPSLSGYSFNYGNEEFLLAKKINVTESREEGDYCIMKIIRGIDDQIGFKMIADSNLTNSIWTKIIDAFSLEEVLETLLERRSTGLSPAEKIIDDIKIKCIDYVKNDCLGE